MSKKFILSCMAIGILAGSVYSNVSATDQESKPIKNQHIQECILTAVDASRLIGEMIDRGSTELIIPNEFTSIENNAFAFCPNITSIDFNNVKNIIGAFYQPKKVLIDSNTLLTLDNRLLNEGLAEAIKMAATFNKDLFNTIKEADNLLDIIDDVIIESLKIKKSVVEEDPFEKGVRKVLNFGHTIGHGIEASLKGTLYHGECVALGMMFFASAEVKKELEEVLIKYNLPVSYNYDKEIVFDYIKHDKKAVGDLINVVYCLKLGTYEIKKIALKDIYDLLGGTNE